MRKITVGAIQPGDLYFAEELDCLYPGFSASDEKIISEHVLPQMEVSLNLLEQSGNARFGAVTTSEDLCSLSRYLTCRDDLFTRLVIKTAPIAEEKLSAIAKKFGMYVIGCYFKNENGENYNTASVFGRDGQICGSYRKTHLPPNELWQVKEGGEINVIETDFGKIGVSICYDMMFAEQTAVLGAKGAEIVFHPTAGYGWYDSIGEATIRTRANDASLNIVTAKNYCFNGAGRSSVVDHWGQILADAGFYRDVIVGHTLDLDVPKTQPEWYYQTRMSNEANMRIRRDAERRADLYGELLLQEQKLSAPDEIRREELREMIKNGMCRW